MTTLVFPGQGSQFVGMAKDFYDNFSSAREIFNKVEDITKKISIYSCLEKWERDYYS